MVEVLTLGVMVSGFLIMMGATFLGKRLLALTLAAAFVGSAFEPVLMKASPDLLASVPAWVRIAGVTIVGLWILQALITFLFGRKVADAAVSSSVRCNTVDG
ncbi:hypothetical protein [Amaricoccus sp.]|uniref:hypothetical protein n=1 Tax=Amaricoccus sp. TaxID=1872485 RepID=UPI001B66E7AD|nr:hypothetical protein [Amaricoccus sp.]MBP7242146.1 hypothetical protein [Amaricoccus sp.]